MQERSAGKDTTTGHWELAGVILHQPFAVFEKFPDHLVRQVELEADVEFIGNYPRSGTQILDELGAEHIRTGKPILYTSADSVLQIAAHENVIPVDQLYRICQVARAHADSYRIGRVIARPFEGEPSKFRRTPRRHDFSMRPPIPGVGEAGLPSAGLRGLFRLDGATNARPGRAPRNSADHRIAVSFHHRSRFQ